MPPEFVFVAKVLRTTALWKAAEGAFCRPITERKLLAAAVAGLLVVIGRTAFAAQAFLRPDLTSSNDMVQCESKE